MKPSLLKTLLDAHIAPFLAGHGFRRSKSTWNRRIGNVVHVIHFQTGKGFTPHMAEQFTVEIGIAVDIVEELLEGKAPRFFRDCLAVATIGNFRSDDDNKFEKPWWDLWSLRNEADIQRAVSDIVDDLNRYVFPILDQITSLYDVKRFIIDISGDETGPSMLPYVRVGLAALCYVMGDLKEYERLKDNLMRGEGLKYAPAVEFWRKRMIEVDRRLRAWNSELSQ